MFSMEMPTAQHWRALAQVDPRTTSSAPVPGMVAMYQPDGAAPLPVWLRMPAAPVTAAAINGAARTNRQAARRRPLRRAGVGASWCRA